VESFYATQHTWNQDEDLKNEATAAKINLRAIIKMKLGGCPLFCNFGKAGMYQALTK
jgi:hypothetical protein